MLDSAAKTKWRKVKTTFDCDREKPFLFSPHEHLYNKDVTKKQGSVASAFFFSSFSQFVYFSVGIRSTYAQMSSFLFFIFSSGYTDGLEDVGILGEGGGRRGQVDVRHVILQHKQIYKANCLHSGPG